MMTPSDLPPTGVDRLTLTVYGADTSADQRSTVGDLYAEVYTEPPYNEGAAEVEDFTSNWSRKVDQQNFRLVVARRADEPIGFAFGLQLRTRTKWWEGAVTPLPTRSPPSTQAAHTARGDTNQSARSNHALAVRYTTR
jgi:hypothetical protein